jgi:2,3-bisphosphoglycerate-dependent phosphoglycerate mutase
MDLLLVRHAEPQRIEGGTGVRANPSLTQRGRRQAERLAAWLAHERIDAVVSSPQQRAIETAEPVGKAHALELEVFDDLVEFDVQADHYIPVEELKATNDPRWRAMVDGTFHDFGGEDPARFRRRVLAAIDTLIDRHAGQRVVAVCHGGVVNVALGAVLGIARPLWFDPAYTSLSRVAASRAGVRSLVTLNETAHLEARRHT